MKLSEYARGLNTKGVKFRGKDLILHRVTAAETMAVAAVFPSPRAPMFKNPAKGGLAEPEPDYEHPAYKAENMANFTKREACLLALAMKLEVLNKGPAPLPDDDGFKVWCQLAATEVLRDLDDAEILGLMADVRSISSEANKVSEALGN